jgi:hypothetical protein
MIGWAQEAVPESSAKAAFVFHLTQFTTWPGLAPDAPFKIGILGPDPFGSVLDKIVEGEKVGSRRIVVVRSNFLANLADCQLVYVSAAAADPTPLITNAFKGRPVLIVGDGSDFIAQGGMVRLFRTPERKLRLQVRLPRVHAAGLKMSAQLLRVAEVQEGSP